MLAHNRITAAGVGARHTSLAHIAGAASGVAHSYLLRGLPHGGAVVKAQPELLYSVGLLSHSPDWHCRQAAQQLFSADGLHIDSTVANISIQGKECAMAQHPACFATRPAVKVAM